MYDGYAAAAAAATAAKDDDACVLPCCQNYIGSHFRGANVFAVDPLAPDYDPLDMQSKTVSRMGGGMAKGAVSVARATRQVR
jgi:hypothetical protein